MKRLMIAAAALAAVSMASAQNAAPIPAIQEIQLAQTSTPNGPPATGISTSKAEAKSEGMFSGFKNYKGPVGYPGNTWGTIVYNANSRDKLGIGTPRWETQGIVEQGVDWFRFGDGTWKFNTFGAVEYVINGDDQIFVPVLGMKVNKRFENGSLDLGLRVKNRNITVNGIGTGDQPAFNQKKSATVQLYATYWFDWNLKKD